MRPAFWLIRIALSLGGLAVFGQPIQEWSTRVIPLPDEEILQPCEYRMVIPGASAEVKTTWVIFDRGPDYSKWCEDRQIRALIAGFEAPHRTVCSAGPPAARPHASSSRRAHRRTRAGPGSFSPHRSRRQAQRVAPGDRRQTLGRRHVFQLPHATDARSTDPVPHHRQQGSYSGRSAGSVTWRPSCPQ